MPSPKHLCAHNGCATLVTKNATHCQKHRIVTPEHQARINASLRGRTLSDATRAKISQAHTKGGTTDRICSHCQEPFKTKKPSSKVRFCSRSCGYAQRRGDKAPNWSADMPHFSCRVCGKEQRQVSKVSVRYTCSLTCKAIWQLTHQKNKGTNIERATEAELIKRKWEYQSQVALCNIAVVDFFLPAINAAIFCDGDYWHSLPGKAEHDAYQSATLRANGYVVFRFLGSEILSDIESCLNQIKHP